MRDRAPPTPQTALAQLELIPPGTLARCKSEALEASVLRRAKHHWCITSAIGGESGLSAGFSLKWENRAIFVDHSAARFPSTSSQRTDCSLLRPCHEGCRRFSADSTLATYMRASYVTATASYAPPCRCARARFNLSFLQSIGAIFRGAT